jgi:hypothetical protein
MITGLSDFLMIGWLNGLMKLPKKEKMIPEGIEPSTY